MKTDKSAESEGASAQRRVSLKAKTAAASAKRLERAASAAEKVKEPKRTPEEQRAEIERVAHEHGADLSEEGFNEVLRKVGRKP